ncbi:MAG: LPS export ABC transporter periplasmic protein LptC [Pseudomonadota bacterium]
MADERLHSGLVAGAKILLPLAALGILSSVVYFARDNEDVREIPFVDVDGPEYERERVTRPDYVTVTDDGGALRITALEVVPSPEDRNVLIADSIAGRLETASGRIVQATSPTGWLNTTNDQAELTGIVSVDSSDGFHVLTETLSARLDVTYIQSGGPVWGEAPFGQIEAGAMSLGEPDTQSDLLRFTDGVKVIYQPQN